MPIPVKNFRIWLLAPLCAVTCFMTAALHAAGQKDLGRQGDGRQLQQRAVPPLKSARHKDRDGFLGRAPAPARVLRRPPLARR